MRIKHPTERAAIYKQGKSNNWYLDYYIVVDGKNKRKQKGAFTQDKEEAMRQLEEIILVNRLVREGKIDLKETHYKSVSDIAKIIIKRFKKSENKKPIYKDYIRKLKEILKEYKNFDIKKLDKPELRKFFFNKTYSQTQLRITRKSFSLIFEYAEENNFIEKIPTFPSVDLKEKEERESYTEEELKFLKNRFTELSQTSKNKKGRENFLLLYYFIELLELTGIRYGELREIKTNNIYQRDNQTYIKIDKSKTAKRTILSPKNAVFIIEKLDKGQEYLFEREDKKIPDFSQVLQGDRQRNEKLYKELNIHHKTLYNIRHSFINKKIIEGKELFMIAQHCGTSLQMIQEYYSDMIVNRDYNNIYQSDFETEMDEWADMIIMDNKKEKLAGNTIKLENKKENISN